MSRLDVPSTFVVVGGYALVVFAAVAVTVWTAGSMGPFATVTVAAIALAGVGAFDRWYRGESTVRSESETGS